MFLLQEFTGTGEVLVEPDGAITLASVGSTALRPVTAGIHELRSNAAAEEVERQSFTSMASTGTATQFRPVSGTNGNAAAMAMRIGCMTMRHLVQSMLAEQSMPLEQTTPNDIDQVWRLSALQQGDICGIFDSNGLLTNVFADAISFVQVNQSVLCWW